MHINPEFCLQFQEFTVSLISNHLNVSHPEAPGRPSCMEAQTVQSLRALYLEGPHVRFNVLLSLSAVLITFQQGAPKFHCTLDPANSIASPDPVRTY